MKALQTPLIANRATRQLSALGFKQLHRIIDKACEANGTHRYKADSKPLKAQVETLVYSLIFDHSVTKEQLSTLQKQIKVVNNQLHLPSIATL
ncbi:MAG TPA: hypothetical protein VN698_13900 [Bacteroidia bacterium]|nr:hypothetical protein [Bacteroidia bacterium]